MQDIYLTEFGYLTPDRRGPLDPHRNPFPKVSPVRQGALQARAHQLAWLQPQVKMFAQFLVRDTTCVLGSGLECIDWTSGFRYGDGSAKPARAALDATLLVTRQPNGERAIWGRLGRLQLRDQAVLEYRDGQTWRPVRVQDVRAFAGGAGDGIFSLRVRGVNTEEFRVGAR
jgi:hypothetical protein